jgi:hypothetical protein
MSYEHEKPHAGHIFAVECESDDTWVVVVRRTVDAPARKVSRVYRPGCAAMPQGGAIEIPPKLVKGVDGYDWKDLIEYVSGIDLWSKKP